MASIKVSQGKYLSLEDSPYLDHEDDCGSETTAYSDLIEKASAGKESKLSSKCSKTSRLQTLLPWLRWGFVVILQTVILVVLIFRKPDATRVPSAPKSTSIQETIALGEKNTETGGDINGLYVPTSHKYTLLTPEIHKFVPNMTSDENRMEIRHNWDMLMPLGSGSIEILDHEDHPLLGDPIIDDPLRTGAIYEASWTHALHCLYYSVDTYHQLIVSGGKKSGFKGEINHSHAGHCFEYLRNQILCMADMTLEGSKSLLDATGEGQAHMCRNRNEAIDWIEARRLDDIQSIVGP